MTISAPLFLFLLRSQTRSLSSSYHLSQSQNSLWVPPLFIEMTMYFLQLKNTNGLLIVARWIQTHSHTSQGSKKLDVVVLSDIAAYPILILSMSSTPVTLTFSSLNALSALPSAPRLLFLKYSFSISVTVNFHRHCTKTVTKQVWQLLWRIT